MPSTDASGPRTPPDWRIGIDLGGTKIAAGLVDAASGRLVHASRRPTPVADGPAAIIASVIEAAAGLGALAAREGQAVSCAGIAVPELVDHEGRVASRWNFEIDGIADAASAALGGLPVHAASDVQAAAHAEARFGSGAGLDSFAYVSLGTGLSYTLCIDGKPWKGAHGFAIHFASSPLSVPAAADEGLATAIPEDFASGRGMARTYERRTGRALPGGARRLERLGGQGCAEACRVIDEAAAVTGRLLAQMVNMIDPDALVLGGGLGCSTGRYRTALETHMRDAIWAERCRAIPLLTAGLGESAGTIGAALAGTFSRRGAKVTAGCLA